MADRTVVYRLEAAIAGFQASMAQAGASVRKLGDDMTSMDKSAVRNRQALDQLGGTAGKFGLVAAAGLGAVVVASANFDQAMSEVQAATHETSSNMDLLRQAALDAGQATAFSATEAAAGIEELSKAGVSTRDILGGGLTGALDLAAAGGIEVAEAAETAASAMTQFRLSGEQVPHVADLLAAGAGKAQGSVSDLGMALNQSGLVASQTGLTIEETTGTLAAFASAGLTGSDAGTSFKTMLQSLTPTSVKARELMDELGISAYDAQGNFVGMTEFAASLQAGLADLSVEQQNAAMKTIFGSDAVRAASVVFEQGADGVQTWINNVDDAGYAAETAATRMDNLKGDFEELTGSLETALIGTGSGAQGPLRSMVQSLTDVVNAYNNLPPAAQGAVSAVLAGGALLGGSVWVGSKLIQGIADTREAFSTLGIEAGKTNRAMAVVGKGIEFAILIQGVTMLDEAFAKLFNTTLEGDLSRNLDALANGEVVGNLDTLGAKLETLASTGMSVQNRIFGWLPGSTAFESAAEDVGKVDEALAAMVEGGRQEEAAAIFGQIVAMAKESGVSAAEAAKQFDQYGLALRNVNGTAGLLSPAFEAMAEAARGFASAENGSTSATDRNTQSLRENIAAMRDKREAAVGAFDAETRYRQALVAAEKAAKDNSAGIRGNSKAALENRGRLSELAAAWNNQSNAVKNTEGRFRQARSAFIDTAVAMGVPKREAIELAKRLMEIPPKRHTDVTVETGRAQQNVKNLLNTMAQLRNRTVTVTTVFTQSGNRFKDFGPSGSADGSTVPKDGRPYADRYPYLLAPGEEVISNRSGQADRWRPLLKAINAGRLADGGTAGRLAGGGTASALMGPWAGTSQGQLTMLQHELDGFSYALVESSKGLKVELEQRLEAASKLKDAEKARLDSLKQQQSALEESVQSLYRSDVFGQSNVADLPFSDEFRSAAAVASARGALASDLAAAKEAFKLLRELQSRGFNGPLFRELAASGDVNALRGFADLSRRELRQYEEMYSQRQRVSAATGRLAGRDLQPSIDAQTAVFREAREEWRETNQRLNRLERLAEKAPKETGSEVSKNINKVVTAGYRERR